MHMHMSLHFIQLGKCDERHCVMKEAFYLHFNDDHLSREWETRSL